MAYLLSKMVVVISLIFITMCYSIVETGNGLSKRPKGEKISGPRDPWAAPPGSSVDPPRSSVTVNVYQVNSTEVNINWSLPYGGAYSITLLIKSGGNVEFETQMNGQQRELTIINVTPEKLYTATVVALYRGGGRASGSRNFRTSRN